MSWSLRTHLTLILVGGVLAGTVTAAWAQRESASRRWSRAESLTVSLVREHAELLGAGPADRDAVGRRLAVTVASRRAELAALISDDPEEVLRLAVAPRVRDALPEEVRALVEEHVSVTGELDVFTEDYERGARVRYYLQDARGQRLALHLVSDPPDVQSGDQVVVTGVQLGDDLAADGGPGGSVELVSTVLPKTFGDQRTLVILVNFEDKPTEPATVEAVRKLLFTDVSKFYLENSQNQTWLTGDVAGWFTIPLTSTVCDSWLLGVQARQAATNAGVDLTEYSRLVYAFPKNACSWLGLGQMGGKQTQAWINGSLNTRVVAHELGHNLGLSHARALECGSATLGPSCSLIEYGDPADIMGQLGVTAHFNAYAKERLGWLNYGRSLPLTTVTGTGTYAIEPYAGTGPGAHGLKILKQVDSTTGKRTYYYVEYRRGVNFDSSLAGNANLANGVVVHTGSDPGSYSLVLDMTPSTTSWTDPALTVNKTFTDPETGLSLTPVSVGSAGASVFVQLGGAACTAAAPAVSLTPAETQWAMPGASVSWTMTVKNNDGAACGPSVFSLAGVVPAGWSGVFPSPSMSVSPGQTGSTTFKVTSSTTAADGFYDVQAQAARGSTAASAKATYAVMSPLSVRVTTGAAIYSVRQQVVDIFVAVSNSTTDLVGVPVSIVIAKPDGTKLTASVTTGSSGRGTYRLGLLPRDPLGIWTVSATATVNGRAATGKTTFTVK